MVSGKSRRKNAFLVTGGISSRTCSLRAFCCFSKKTSACFVVLESMPESVLLFVLRDAKCFSPAPAPQKIHCAVLSGIVQLYTVKIVQPLSCSCALCTICTLNYAVCTVKIVNSASFSYALCTPRTLRHELCKIQVLRPAKLPKDFLRPFQVHKQSPSQFANTL